MKLARFFVTVAAILGFVYGLGFQSGRQTSSEGLLNLAEEGNAKIQQALALEANLLAKYHLPLAANKFTWKNLTRAERREIQGKVSHLLVLINRVLEIDTVENVIIENKEPLLVSRNAALILQKSLENFEQMYGENFSGSQDVQADANGQQKTVDINI